MKLILEINGMKLLLDADQVRQVADLLHGCEYFESKYIPSSGNTKSSYIDLIKPISVREVLKVHIMNQTDYDALVLITKLQGE